MKARNEKRIAKKHVAYRKVIASDFHRQLRYKAWERSGGLCECEQCARWRSHRDGQTLHAGSEGELRMAFTPPLVWLTNKGGQPWRRFCSTEGELHHTTYKYFGEEHPAELEHVRWMWKACHKRIEAEHHTRRNYLRGGR